MNPLNSIDPKTQNSVFTERGFDPRGNNEYGAMAHKQLAYIYPEANNELEWLMNYSGPKMRSLIESLVNQMNDPNALESDYRSFANSAYEDAGRGGNLLANQLRGKGYGEGATGGAISGAYGDARRDVNQYKSQQMSPQQRLQRLMASLQGLQAGAGTPALKIQNQLSGVVEGRHQQNEQERQSGGFAPFLGAVGSYLGGGGMKPQQQQITQQFQQPMSLFQDPNQNWT